MVKLWSIFAAALLSLPLAAEGVLPWDGKWVQGPCSSASALKIEDDKVVGVVEIPRKNMKYARYSADKKIAPLKGDIELSARLNYTTRDKLFLGYAYIQAVDTANKAMAGVGLYDGWERSASRYYAGIVGSNAKLPVKNLPVVVVEKTENLQAQLSRQDGQRAMVAISGRVKTYGELTALAQTLGKTTTGEFLLCLESDMAKALGQKLRLMYPHRPCLCIDRIKLTEGSYLDIGKPVGSAFPVIVKTLVLGK